MDSVAFLRELATDAARTRATTLFYLDAHWGKRLPLAEEVTVITRAFPASMMLIDDFKVADDPGYGFDDYGEGKRLDIDYVRRIGVNGLAAFFPALPSEEENPPRRGCVVLSASPALIERLAADPLLRRYPL
jgi:hypothetical protein